MSNCNQSLLTAGSQTPYLEATGRSCLLFSVFVHVSVCHSAIALTSPFVHSSIWPRYLPYALPFSVPSLSSSHHAPHPFLWQPWIESLSSWCPVLPTQLYPPLASTEFLSPPGHFWAHPSHLQLSGPHLCSLPLLSIFLVPDPGSSEKVFLGGSLLSPLLPSTFSFLICLFFSVPSLSSSSMLKPKLSPCPRCPHPLLAVSGSDSMTQPVSYTANSACLGLQAGLQTSFDSLSHSEMVNLLFFTYYCSSSPLHFADSRSDHCSTRPFN